MFAKLSNKITFAVQLNFRVKAGENEVQSHINFVQKSFVSILSTFYDQLFLYESVLHNFCVPTVSVKFRHKEFNKKA